MEFVPHRRLKAGKGSMPLTSIEPSAALPRSYCFVSLSHGRSIRTLRMRTGLACGVVGLLGLLGLWTAASSTYLMLHDDLVATLMTREAAAQYAYEDRIAALRGQVEREASLKLVGETTLAGRLGALTRRAEALETRESLLAAVAGRAGRPLTSAGADAPSSSPVRTGTIGAAAKPHPEIEGAADDPARATLAAAAAPFAQRLASVENRLDRVDLEQVRHLGGIAAATHRHAEALREAILATGLSVERIARGAPAADVGGPFVPLDPALLQSSFGQAVEAMRGDVVAIDALTEALPKVPLAKPLAGPLEVTSPFGARLDPFQGRPAMHTGVDLRDGYGTDVRATASGRVVSAGPAGGYGTMIEIDHGHGLSTRYAHLMAVGVAPGQLVGQGAVIGEVGATGRATGPHLHYETRIDGEAVDPERFLVAGARLAAAEGIAD